LSAFAVICGRFVIVVIAVIHRHCVMWSFRLHDAMTMNDGNDDDDE